MIGRPPGCWAFGGDAVYSNHMMVCLTRKKKSGEPVRCAQQPAAARRHRTTDHRTHTLSSCNSLALPLPNTTPESPRTSARLPTRAMLTSTAATGAAHARAAALSLVLWCFFSNTPTTCGFQATTMMVARGSWKEYWLAKNSAQNAPAAIPSTRGTARRRRSSRTRWEPTRPAWWIAKSPAKVQGAPPVLATPVLDGESFDTEQITDVLQHEYRHNLVRVAQKYDSLIESVEGVDAITIKELDG